MAISISTLSSQFIDIITADTDTEAVVRSDITQSPGSVYYISVQNGIGSTSISLKLYDATTATLGTTEPVFILKVAASATEYCVIPDGMAFSTGISYAVTDQNGRQAAGSGFGSVSGNVTLRMVVS
jgi:hypothetical protein